MINRSVQILSLVNDSFLTKNWGANLQEVFSFEILPDNYFKLVTTLCTENNFDEMIILGRKLLENTRKLVLEEQQDFSINQSEKKNQMCNKYISMKAYINKIMSACHKRDILAVSYAATELQIWIAEEIATCEGNLVVNVDNFNLFEEIKIFYTQLNFPDLMNGVSKVNFQEIEKTAKELDFKLLEYCKNQKFKIPKFQYLEEVNSYCER